MLKIKTLSSEIIHQNPWWVYKHDIFELGGKEGHYYYGEKPGGSMAIPILDDGRLVLIRQHRYLLDKSCVEFPCGAIDKGEMPPEAARRELLEETGYQASEMVNIGSFEPCGGVIKNKMHVFVATGLTLLIAAPERTEQLEVIYRRVDEFEEMIERGEVWDGITLAAWALSRTHINNNENV